MVVSKDSKRKRKESPQTQSAVESSPEMPKRTKVQAQRKFAQGQSAPASTSYNSVIAASSSSNTGPSTSSESREPPTEILPNKRPKTEDFLTFLCFRGTPALPAHCDFLNQGKSKDAELPPVKKNASKPAKATKKSKKGRPKAAAKNEESTASTSTAQQSVPPAVNVDKNETITTKVTQIQENNVPEEEAPATTAPLVQSSSEEAVIPFAVRKRAEVVTEGNRRSRATERQLRNAAPNAEKCNNSPEIKRRSNRTSIKDIKPITTDPDTEDEDDEYFSANDEGAKIEEHGKEHAASTRSESKKSKTPLLPERKSETPSKESETGKPRKGRPASTTKNAVKDVLKENTTDENTSKDCPIVLQKPEQPIPVKEKAPVKRPRQKESPIFIPSPEPSGRMTRQRAFFEPVKVPHRNEETEIDKTDKSLAKIEVIQTDADTKTENSDVSAVKVSKESRVTTGKATAKSAKQDNCDQNVVSDKGKSNLNVFDFSSDDEQPLAKSIKLKRGKGSPKKGAAPRANKTTRKLSPKKVSEAKDEIKCKSNEKLEDTINKVDKNIEPHKDAKEENQEELERSKNTSKRGKNLKKKADDEIVQENKELSPPSPKKAAVARQSRKKAKATEAQVKSINGEDEAEAPVRSQRPTRKTKEAAAIYMGIIGHKLQLADDEDDDLSLNSFPDLPNVKEMEKMENEIRKNAVASGKNACNIASTSPTAANKISPKQTTLTIDSSAAIEKPASARRGRPPKQSKQQQSPVKREIEGMLVKKGAISKMSMAVDGNSAQNKTKSEPSKADSDDEDFLLNEEVNETKRKLEKSFSDSDDEPLAIKANVKSNDKDVERNEISPKSEIAAQSTTMAAAVAATTLAMLPLTAKPVPTPSLTATQTANLSSPITAPQQQFQQQNTSQAPPTPFKAIEKKSPVPTSKILNVPATYAIPMSNSSIPPLPNAMNANFSKTPSYLPQASPLYHTASHIVRQSPAHQFPTAKSPTGPPSASSIPATHLTAPPPPPPQSPLKYQTAPTTYPPPIEAYPSPKINPNFLTPKFDRTTLPRPNNFPSPSPVKFDISSTTTPTSKAAGIASNMAIGIKTAGNVTVAVAGGSGNGSAVPPSGAIASTSAATGANAAVNAITPSADPLKDEIGSILAANLMPSKEESGKIFGIASVSLAQSSGPDNTKCTLGKCGSIHKPVLGPVVPTEGYIGDQLSSKERRKAKVNMTHEQIQKWLIECSSNPDEIQDDLDDDFDDNLRPNLFATTPPPTRDDKESTSFSSSSKATRDLGKSESAWSAKGPSLKATPVVATTNRKDDSSRLLDAINQLDIPTDNEKANAQAINLTHKTGMKQNPNSTSEVKAPTKPEKADKKSDKKPREEKAKAEKESTSKDSNKTSKIDKEKDIAISNDTKLTVAGKQSSLVANSNQTLVDTPTTSKPNRRKNAAGASTVTSSATVEKATTSKTTATTALSVEAAATATATKQHKRTPVYNQKAQIAQKQVELKVTTTTSHKKTAPFSYIAFSAENEKSIYSFDKDDDEPNGSKAITKPPFRRQSRRDSHLEEAVNTTTISTRASPTKKRAAAAAAEKANKDIANASQSSSVSLTLSPSENSKHVKVSLDAEKTVAAATTTTTTPKPTSGKASKSTQKTEMIAEAAAAPAATAPAGNADADSDSDGHTFYIPLQGSGTGGDGEGGIQGVAVKLGREGPDGPNQKVIMHATLVTKAQMGSNSKPLPDSMNVSDIVKTLMTSSNVANIANTAPTAESTAKKNSASHSNVMPSTSAAAAAAAAAAATTSANSASNSLKSVPIGTVQPRFKASDPAATNQPATSNTAAAGGTGTAASTGLVRVNSNSSLFSGSAKSRICGIPGPAAHASNKKFKDDTPIKMSNNTAFPRHDDPTQMVEAPIFRPTEKEFADPIDFIERITPIAARFGICKIIPPATFKPECRISDEMRFTAYNQYVHKMLHRWGPSAKELSAIKKYLATQSIVMNHPPWIGGMEVDLPRLYHTVQELGGLKEVIEKKKWTRVAEEMCIPKLAQDRVTKLDDIYCKYLLPYDTLSPAERQKLFDEVEADWAKREARARRNADRFVNTESVSNEEDDVSSEDDEESEEEVDGVSMECIVKGRSMPLSQFYRIARNTMALWFKNTEPIVNEVEAEFWRHVAVRDSHVCVHSGSIDSSGWGYGFPTPGPKGKSSNYSRHPWNLKVLTNNPGSVLRSLGPVMGVTVPTLHVGMLFSACCWYRDPHGLSWIEYLHTGASKLWYGIPDDQSANFRAALTSLIPTHCQNKTIWLPCDTVMVPPHMLTDRGVSLCRIEQKPGEFIVVFPRAYTSSLATGYVVSESVYFATTSWLELAKDDFRDIHDSCEPAMFSLEQLLFALGYDQRVTSDTLQQMLPMLYEVCEKETAAREQLKAAGVTSTEKVHNEKGSKTKKQQQPPFKSIDSECDLCRANLYISMVKTEEGNVYCLQHALKNLNNGNIQAKQCKLIYAYNLEDIENLIKNLKDKIQIKRNAIANKKAK